MKKIFRFLTTLIFSFFFIVPAFSKEQMVILVDDIKNRSGKGQDWISESIMDTIIGDLSVIKNISVISQESRETALQEIEMTKTGLVDNKSEVETGHMISANIVLRGSYTVIGKNIRVVVRLTDVNTGSVYRTVKLDGKVNNLFSLQDKIVQRLLSEVEKIDRKNLPKIKISSNDRKKIARAKTNIDPAAYKLYTKGMRLKRSDPKTALQLLKSAFEISPKFARAYIEAAYIAGIKLKKTELALRYMKKGERLYRKAGKQKTLSYYRIYQKYAYIYFIRKDYDTSLKYMNYLVNHFRKHNYTKSTSNSYAYSLIGNIYHKKKSVKKFSQNYRKAISIAESLEPVKKYSCAGIYSSYARYAYLNKMKGESKKFYPVAIEYYQKYYRHLKTGKKQHKAKEILLKKSKAMINYSFIMAKARKFNIALKYLNLSKKSLEKLNMKKSFYYGKLYYMWGEYFRLKKESKLAERKYNQAIDIFKAISYNKKLYTLAQKRIKKLNNGKRSKRRNLLKNGNFEKEFTHWGTGLYSQPSHRNSITGFWGRAKAYVAFNLMKQNYKNKKSKVLVLRNYSFKAPHVYKTIAQRISGLKKNTDYVLEYMVYVKEGKPGVLFFTFDPAWNKRSYPPLHFRQWKKYRYTYNTGKSSYVDLRIITENKGEAWLDDIRFYEK